MYICVYACVDACVCEREKKKQSEKVPGQGLPIPGWKCAKLIWMTHARAESGDASRGEGGGSADDGSEASGLDEHGERVFEGIGLSWRRLKSRLRFGLA